ncbi:hypothetical protein K432DRAFT_396776 [Lepidopterella palustris CBS 459.81]|uniref:Uncharacterized protein n=1 Tax=Lepidopterella palustris CBS 459.81 TaxID=1314670 RepID=A0A8E2JB18_9PEZI|nr:hypothetical protein K432DRAFT_396776 [Lepidopterella palustris CBS 459.81]
MSTNFFAFPREIRDQIYEEVFYSPNGIHLNLQRRLALQGRKDFFDVFRGLGSVDPLPGFLYTNRQIYEEAVEALYRVNTNYSFDGSWLPEARKPRELTPTSKDIHNFLTSLPSSARRRIKSIQFDADTFRNDQAGRVEQWDNICDFLADENNGLRIQTVTVGVPITLYQDPDQHLAWAQYCRYWWPALRELTRLLMSGKFQEMRLLHPRTYGPFPGRSVAPETDLDAPNTYMAFSNCKLQRVKADDKQFEERRLTPEWYGAMRVFDPNEDNDPWKEVDTLACLRPRWELDVERDTSDINGTVLVLRKKQEG